MFSEANNEDMDVSLGVLLWRLPGISVERQQSGRRHDGEVGPRAFNLSILQQSFGLK